MDWRRLARLRRRPDVRAEAPELDQLLAAAPRTANTQMVDRETDGGRAVRSVLSGLLTEIDLEQLTAAGGIPRRSGFLKELYERCLAAILPQPEYRSEPTLLVGECSRARTMAWIDLLPSDDARKMARPFIIPESSERIDPRLDPPC